MDSKLPSLKPEQENLQGTEYLNISRYLFKKNRWILFMFTAAGLIAGSIYFQAIPEKYLVSATLLVDQENKNPELKNIFRQVNPIKKSSDIEDQIGLLKSYRLNYEAIEKLNWTHRWSKVTWIGSTDLYPTEPLKLEVHMVHRQSKGIPIKISVLPGGNGIRLNVSIDPEKSKTTNSLEFDQVLKYGERFKNEYFDFTIDKPADRVPIKGETFYLEFTDAADFANAYKKELDAGKFNPAIESNLIRLNLNSASIERDAEFLNELMHVYLKYGIEEKNRLADQTIRFIDDQISGVNHSLESAGKKFTSFRTKNKTVNLNLEANSIVTKQNQVEEELSQLRNRLNYYRNLRGYLESEDEKQNTAAPVFTGFTDEALKNKVDRLNELSTRRQILKMTAQEKNPVLIAIENEIGFSKEILLENINRMIEQSEAETQSLLDRENDIQKAVARLPLTEKDMIGIKRNFDLNNEIYTFLLERRAEAQIMRASNDSNARIIDLASPATALLTGPVLPLDLFVGSIIGLLIGIGFVLIRYFSSGILTDAEEIRSGMSIAPLGEIIQAGSGAEDIRSNPRSALAESIRGLRINITGLLEQLNGKVIAIHSILPGSGKSFITRNLAIAFSLQNKKVLLIDADLKRPSLNKLFEMETETGLSDYLAGSKNISQIIFKTKISEIDLIPAGPSSQLQSDQLEKSLIQDLLKKTEPHYDLIIIDNAPFGLISDPKLVGSVADLNLFLIRLDHSKRSELSDLNRLGRGGFIKGMAIVLNGTPVPDHYGYYSESGKSWKELFNELPRLNRSLQPILNPIAEKSFTKEIFSDKNPATPSRSETDHNSR